MSDLEDYKISLPPLKVAIICFINDPFDQPGGRRIGGGHLVLDELGQHLVARGDDVTYITRLNSEQKEEFSQLGPRCRIYRLSVGPAKELPPSEVGAMLDKLEEETHIIFENSCSDLNVIHSQYWIAGEVSRRINKRLGLKHIHYMLSFGRQKAARGEERGISDSLRDQSEIKVFNEVDCLIAQCPSEANDLLSFYPELNHNRIKIIPHGVDPYDFSPRI
ncbi:glycosyltransferase [Oceanospirillum beijerinckii]|uniref:glycosyltransferase n=1 Tax=Oceanospirillum beijerinckii TaxID=64976 RepID=UPI000483BD60|nr:glycosyltransferase [Oceanospirillum beijerinckii]